MIEPQNAFPVVVVKDLEAAKSFYVENFGFDVVFPAHGIFTWLPRRVFRLAFFYLNSRLSRPYFNNHIVAEALSLAWKSMMLAQHFRRRNRS